MIRDVVSKVAGSDIVPIIFNIEGKVNVSEFIIADELHIDIRELRKKLYRLWENGLVVFKRKKDKKRGWYIYYWTFIPSRVWFLYKELRKRRLEELKHRLEREESNEFYICPNGCMRLDFEKAMEYDFHCPECGAVLVPNDNSRTIEHLKEEIAKLEKEIVDIEKEEKSFNKEAKKKAKEEIKKLKKEEEHPKEKKVKKKVRPVKKRKKVVKKVKKVKKSKSKTTKSKKSSKKKKSSKRRVLKKKKK